MSAHENDALVLRSPEDLTRRLAALPWPSEPARREAAKRQTTLTKPAGSLGRLEELAVWIAGWQARANPRLDRVPCVVFAGNHGVAAQGVSAYPAEVTAQMVANFRDGGAAINQLCALARADLAVVPLDLDRPTGDITKEDAMSPEDCVRALQTGIDSVPEAADLLLVGEMGIGNTTAAAAIGLAIFGGEADDWTGRGTGVAADGLQRKRAAVSAAVHRVGTTPASAFERLRTIGGRELAAIAGAVLAARLRSIPVLLDGFVAAAAVAPLWAENPRALDHVVLSHMSAEHGHARLAAALQKRPVLDLEMRLGEASGAATCLLLARAAVATHNGMATFTAAGVSTSAP